MTSTPVRRSAFTLVELLIVIALIATMAALTVVAVVALRGSQERSTTEALLEKLASALQQQWVAAFEEAKNDFDQNKNPAAINAVIAAVPNGDRRVAKVVYTKIRLKQEFPASFYDALNPAPGLNLPAGGPAFVARPAFANALIGFTPNPNAPLEGESSAMLYLALKSQRRGMGYEVLESVESSAMEVKSFSNGPTPLSIFRDAWGNPLRFTPTPFFVVELNQTPYVKATGAGTTAATSVTDPIDPERRLHPNGPWDGAFAAKFQGQWRIHPLERSKPRNVVPVVASAGKDGVWGDATAAVSLTGNSPVPASLAALLYFAHTGSTADGNADDNLYSYRLRQGGN